MRAERHTGTFIFAAALAGAAFLFPGSSFAQSGDADMRSFNNRLERIEREISDIQRYSYGGGSASSAASSVGASSGGNSADLQSRIFELEDQVRVLTGRLEEASHQAEQATRNLETFKADVELRFQDLQSGGSGAAVPASTPAASGNSEPASVPSSGGNLAAPSGAAEANSAGQGAGRSVLPDGTPESQYDHGIELVKRGQYGQARDAFLEFLKLHPQHRLAGNAQYWLGETYYAEKDYKRAGDAFLTGYTTYASSNKAPDSLLKLGMSLSALGNGDAACTVWGELGSRFPQAAPSIVARAKQERQKAGC